ncbi:hypothetical protein [Caballeronia sp. PC1]|nr:hypothetical protein [Caballeronia sp. PC1]EKS70391.1 hypothetical protein BURK_020005 [Burkholderia sp. SJ98]MCE4546334.1 hypothetical protein [Caballeronia sp. PC1]
MSKNTHFDTISSAVALSSLIPNASFKSVFRTAKQLPGNLPVLNATVDSQKLAALLQPHQIGSIPTCFGFGSMEARSKVGDTMQIMTIRFQLGGVQFYWLADMSDGEVWRAIDAWRKRKQVALVVGHVDQRAFLVAHYNPERSSLDRFKGDIRPEPSSEFFDLVCDVASNGFVAAQATTDIPGTALQQVVVNVLVSPRQQQYLNGSARRGESAMAEGSMSVH